MQSPQQDDVRSAASIYDPAHHRLTSSGFTSVPVGSRLYLTVTEAQNPQQYLLRVLQISELADESDAVRFDAAHPASLAPPVWNDSPPNQVLIDAVKIGGIAASIGAVAWALRAGGLLASLVASVPVWMRFDPLAILVFEDDDGKKKELDWGLEPNEEISRQERAARNLFQAERSAAKATQP